MTEKAKTILSTENGAFSGADAIASIIFPGMPAITIGQVTTVTYSTYRETVPVRTLGRINVKGFSKGQRTIAGTIIFTVFEKHIVNQLKEQVDYLKYIRKLKPCELPPFDIMISFGNEYGSSAKIFIYGIEVVDEGKIFSVEDMFTENTWSYMARDIDLMDDIDAEQNAPLISIGETSGSGSFNVSDLVGDSDYLKMQEALDKLKNEKQQAVEDARSQANDYITSPDNYGSENVTIPMPGGNLEYQPGFDPEESNCPKLEFRQASSLNPSIDPSKESIIWLRFGLQGNDKTRQIELCKELIKSVKIRCSFKCQHGASGAWEFSFDKRLVTSVPGSTTHVQADLCLIATNVVNHKPNEPDIQVSIDAQALGYKGTTYKLKGTTSQKYGNLGTSKGSPIEWIFYKTNSISGQVEEESKSIEAHIDFTRLNPHLSQIQGNTSTTHTGNNVQYVFRDASSIGNKKYNVGKDMLDTDGGYFTCKDAWVYDKRLANYFIKQDGIDWDPKPFKASALPKLRPGFLPKITFKKNGEPHTVIDDNYVVRMKYKIVANVYGKEIILDGEDRNNVIAQKLQTDDNKRWLWLSDAKEYPISLFKGGKAIEPYDKSMEFITSGGIGNSKVGLATYIYRAVHMTGQGTPGRDSKKFTKSMIEKELPEHFIGSKNTSGTEQLCNCRFKYSKMTLVVYDFKIVNKKYNTEIKTTSNFKELKFPIADLNDAMIEVLKPIVNK